jgi:hypothetical protein
MRQIARMSLFVASVITFVDMAALHGGEAR